MTQVRTRQAMISSIKRLTKYKLLLGLFAAHRRLQYDAQQPRSRAVAAVALHEAHRALAPRAVAHHDDALRMQARVSNTASAKVCRLRHTLAA